VKFAYHTLTIVAMALLGGMAHSYFVSIKTRFGTSDDTRLAQQLPVGAQQGADTEQPGPEHTPPVIIEGPTPTPTPAVPAQTQSAPPDLSALGPFISLEEAHAVWQAGFVEFTHFVAFLDARYPELYEQGHITGARRLMAGDLTQSAAGAPTVRWLTDEQPDIIVIYCEGGECDASKNLAEQLELLGFSPDRMHVLKAGYDAWATAHPALSHDGPQPGEPQ
jgi:rhodanese-related sulfurtransferase